MTQNPKENGPFSISMHLKSMMKQIIADKQALRDAPALTSIDAATTPDELKAIQPIPNVTVE